MCLYTTLQSKQLLKMKMKKSFKNYRYIDHLSQYISVQKFAKNVCEICYHGYKIFDMIFLYCELVEDKFFLIKSKTWMGDRRRNIVFYPSPRSA